MHLLFSKAADSRSSDFFHTPNIDFDIEQKQVQPDMDNSMVWRFKKEK